MLRWELARGLRAPLCDCLPIRTALCFAYEVSALQNDFANTGCLYSKSRTLRRLLHLRCPLQPPNPFCKAITSIAEKLLEKVLTFCAVSAKSVSQDVCLPGKLPPDLFREHRVSNRTTPMKNKLILPSKRILSEARFICFFFWLYAQFHLRWRSPSRD